jgi:hypothetical protein
MIASGYCANRTVYYYSLCQNASSNVLQAVSHDKALYNMPRKVIGLSAYESVTGSMQHHAERLAFQLM